MDKYTADTCLFLRYFTGEPPEQAAQAEAILKRAQKGEIKFVLPSLVVAEIVWTLESSIFNLGKAEAAEKAIAILSMNGIEVEHARLLEEAAVLHAELNIDFTDAFLACFARAGGVKGLYTFDRKDFSKVDWLTLLP